MRTDTTIIYTICNHADNIIIIYIHNEYIAVIPFIVGGVIGIGGGRLKVVMTLSNVTKEQSLKTIFEIYQSDDKEIDIHSECQVLIRTDIYHQLQSYCQ